VTVQFCANGGKEDHRTLNCRVMWTYGLLSAKK